MNNYCLGQIVKSQSAFLELYDKNKESYQYFELWADFIDDFSTDFLSKVISDMGERLIVLFRRNDGKDIRLSLSRRKEIIAELGNSQATLDLDIRSQKEEVEYLKSLSHKPKFIASYHNYKLTPHNSELEAIIKEMDLAEPEIYKIACFCEQRSDAIRLLGIYSKFYLQKPLVILGAGPEGQITRVAGLLWDAPIIYAPKDGANMIIPGQLTLSQYQALRQVFRLP